MVVAKNSALKALTAAALALPSMISEVDAGLPAEHPETDFQYAHYEEGSDRISVDIYQGSIITPITQQADISGNWVVDTFSGATPVLTLPANVAQKTTGASGINGVDATQQVNDNQQAVQVMTGASTRETRFGLDVGLRYFWDDLTLSISGSGSEEADYLSHGYHLGFDWEFNQKFSTLSFGFGQAFDNIEPTTRPLKKDKTDYQFIFGFSQILSKKSLFHLSANYSYREGYLSNPYKKVFVQAASSNTDLVSAGVSNIFYENRPKTRNQGSIAVGYIHYLETFDASLHLDYRYFVDSWEIDSHTFEAVWHQPLGQAWMLIPRIRYYSQSKANFYQVYFSMPRADNYYSSDYRLADFGTLSGGLKLTKKFVGVAEWTESIQFEAGVEYSEHAAGLKLGSSSNSELTDFNYFLMSIAIKIQF